MMELEITKRSVGMTAVVLLFMLVLFFVISGPSSSEKIGQTEGIIQYASGSVELNISNMSDKLAEFDAVHEIQYDYEARWKPFTISGIYFDTVFTGLLEDNFGNKLMNVSPRMIPDDGVPSIYIAPLYKEDENMFQAHVFLDQDFLDYVEGSLHVKWGRFYNKTGEVNLNEIVDGVYRDKLPSVEYDRSITPSPYKWAVGNFSGRPTSRPADGIGVYAR